MLAEPQQGEIQPQAYCTAALISVSPTRLAKERIWNIKYKEKPQTPKSQDISHLTSLSQHLFRKLRYEVVSMQRITRDFSVWPTFSPCPPPAMAPKGISLSLIFNSFTKCHMDFQGQRTAFWRLRVRPWCFPWGKPQKTKVKKKTNAK